MWGGVPYYLGSQLPHSPHCHCTMGNESLSAQVSTHRCLGHRQDTRVPGRVAPCEKPGETPACWHGVTSDGAVSGAGYALIWDVEPQWDGQSTSFRHP